MKNSILKFLRLRIMMIPLLGILFLFKSNSGKAQSSSFIDLNMQLREMFAGCVNPNPAVSFFYDMSPHETDSLYFGYQVYDTSNVYNWFDLYKEMYAAAYDTIPYPNEDTVFDRAWEYVIKDTIPLGVIDYKYNLLDSGALDTNLFFIFDTVTNTLTDEPTRPYAPYSIQNIFTASPLYDQSDVGNPVFMIDPAFIFADPPGPGCNTCIWPNMDFRVDFNDGTGWHTFGQTSKSYYEASYTTTGVKMIKFALFNSLGGIEKYSNATFRITKTRILATPDEYINDVEGLTVGLYRGCNSDSSKKYVIYLEGIDLTNLRNVKTIYSEMINEDSIAQLKNFGYSFLVVNFNKTFDDIRTNGMRVVELINNLKADSNLAPLVVIGESMGGLIGRYALRYMELPQYTGASTSNYPAKMHNTRLFLTIDAPHKGANVPLAYQYLSKYGVVVLGPLFSAFQIGIMRKQGVLLNGLSTRQMLLYHVETDTNPLTTLISSSTIDASSERYNLEGSFNTIGRYPLYCKNVATSSGSWLGYNQFRYWDYRDRTPNDILLDMDMERWTRIFGLKLHTNTSSLTLRTNPNGSGTVYESQVTYRRFKIRLKFWKFSAKMETSTLIHIKKDVNDVRPYCVSAGSYAFSDIPLGYEKRDMGLNLLGFFKYKYTTGDGHIHFDYSMGIPGFYKWGWAVNNYTDGTSFGFVHPSSAVDDDSFFVKPLDENKLTYDIDTILARVPFDAIMPNTLYSSHELRNRSHLYEPNPYLGACETCPTPFSGVPVHSYLLNREIGDDTLWLENTRGLIPFKIEAERGLYVNSHNPYYNYHDITGGLSAISQFKFSSSGHISNGEQMVLSKDNPYEVLGAPHEFISNNDFSQTGLSTPSDYTYTVGNMELCCHNYVFDTKRRSLDSTILSTESARFLKVYPNPNRGQTINVQYHFEENNNVKVEVYDMIGKLVSTANHNCTDNFNECNYQLSLNLGNGMYFLKISNGIQSQTAKFIINQ